MENNLMHTGPFTAEERDYCLSIGTVVPDEDCSFGIREKSTICDEQAFDGNLSTGSDHTDGFKGDAVEGNSENLKDMENSEIKKASKKRNKKKLKKEQLKCRFCTKILRTVSARFNHEESHRDLPKCTYGTCASDPTLFTQKSAFYKHLRIFHGKVWEAKFRKPKKVAKKTPKQITESLKPLRPKRKCNL